MVPRCQIIEADCRSALPNIESSSIDALVTDPPAGISFMGKGWDTAKRFREQMAPIFEEVIRVLKPGAHGLVWALPRTSHWTATVLEEVGFEIRDVISHHFGTGFPKSHDVSKAIDKAAGAKREVVGTRRAEDIRGGRLHAKPGDERSFYSIDVTIPATEEARRWDGWGTALKPASEHWILVRKPLDGTVATNVLKHGTGALNIDACRVGNDGGCRANKLYAGSRNSHNCYGDGLNDQRSPIVSGLGRWPANAMFSEGAIAELDRQSEGASRFFYCPKASSKERGAQNDHPTVKSLALMRYLIRLITPPGGTVLDPFCGSGSTGLAAQHEGFSFLGIEQDPHYAEIARQRLSLEADQPPRSKSKPVEQSIYHTIFDAA